MIISSTDPCQIDTKVSFRLASFRVDMTHQLSTIKGDSNQAEKKTWRQTFQEDLQEIRVHGRMPHPLPKNAEVAFWSTAL